MEFEIIVEEAPPSQSHPPLPPAEPKLPVTGTSMPVFVGAGAALLLAGGAALVLMRRRAATAGADWGDDTAK
jgi:LPXTG-motif cell wall-anchored protein